MNDVRPSSIVYTLALDSPEPACKPDSQGRLPRIARLMALALRFEEMLRRGEVRDHAQIARLGHVSRARITQIMNLLNLAPDIQEALLFLEPMRIWRDTLSERLCRDMVREPEWTRQRAMFARLLATSGGKRLPG